MINSCPLPASPLRMHASATLLSLYDCTRRVPSTRNTHLRVLLSCRLSFQKQKASPLPSDHTTPSPTSATALDADLAAGDDNGAGDGDGDSGGDSEGGVGGSGDRGGGGGGGYDGNGLHASLLLPGEARAQVSLAIDYRLSECEDARRLSKLLQCACSQRVLVRQSAAIPLCVVSTPGRKWV